MDKSIIKERPILFTSPMVRAILSGHKTQTRRVIIPQPNAGIRNSPFVLGGLEDLHGMEIKCKYGRPGDRLWIKETYKLAGSMYYRADGEPSREDLECYPNWKWKPSIYMPRAFSRILLEIKAIEVQRLDQITIDDINGEGCPPISCDEDGSELYEWYSDLWDSLNAKRGFGWDTNPWVWAIEFNRIDMPAIFSEAT